MPDEPQDETPEVEAPEPVGTRDVDHIAMVSYNADGTAAQTPGFVVIGEDK